MFKDNGNDDLYVSRLFSTPVAEGAHQLHSENNYLLLNLDNFQLLTNFLEEN